MALTDDQYAAAAWINFHDLGHTMVVVMTAVGMAESQSSGGDTAQSPGYKAGGTGAAGAWQIENNHTEASLGIPGFWSQNLWQNPVDNGRAARKVFDGQGISAWSAYSNGAYAQYLPRAAAAVARVEAKTGVASTANDPTGATVNSPLTQFGQELLGGAGMALSVFGLPTFGANQVTIDKSGNLSTNADIANNPLNPSNLFGAIGPALWIGAGAIMVVLGVIMLNEGSIGTVAKAVAL